MSIEWGLNNNLFNQAKLRSSSHLPRLISVAVIMLVCQFGMFANDTTADIADGSVSSDMKTGRAKDLTVEYNVVAEFNISPLIVSKLSH